MTVRELPLDEWEKLRAFPPFDTGGLPSPEYFRVLVVEVDGRIIGLCGLSNQVHWDPWYVDPTHQGKAGVFRTLVGKGLEVLREFGVHGVHTTVPDTRPDLQQLVEKFGYVAAPGRLYLLHVPDVKEY